MKKLTLHFSPSVYKIKYKSLEEGSKAEEKLVKSPNQDSQTCSVTLTVKLSVKKRDANDF